MDDDRRSVYKKLSKNADEIRGVLKSENFNLAEADRLFRERNTLFYQLKDVFLAKDVGEDELELIEGMINDNNELLAMIEGKKKEMERNFKKREADAKKITSYLKG